MSSTTRDRMTPDSLNRPLVANRAAIVLVGYGTTVPRARKVYDHIGDVVRRQYPQHDVRLAFTSKFIVDKLKRQAIPAKTPAEVVDELRREGRATAVFQSLHIVPGQEYDSVRQLKTPDVRIVVGEALLSGAAEIESVIEILAKKFDPDAPNVVICHGNKQKPQFNRQLIALAEKVEARYGNAVVCAMRGERPGRDKLAWAAKQAARCGRVHFVPLMLMAGVHVMNDTLGDKPHSWKSIIGAKETTCAEPLGYHQETLAIYLRHLDQALSKLDGRPD